jgi:hypothetical protein
MTIYGTGTVLVFFLMVLFSSSLKTELKKSKICWLLIIVDNSQDHRLQNYIALSYLHLNIHPHQRNYN